MGCCMNMFRTESRSLERGPISANALQAGDHGHTDAERWDHDSKPDPYLIVFLSDGCGYYCKAHTSAVSRKGDVSRTRSVNRLTRIHRQ